MNEDRGTLFQGTRSSSDEQIKLEEQEREIFSALFLEMDKELDCLKLSSAKTETGKAYWQTRLHTDGTPDSKGNYTSSVYPDRPHVLVDHARGGKRLIWVLIDMGIYPSYSVALTALSDKAGVALPELSEEARQRIEESRQAAKIVETLHSNFLKPQPDEERKAYIDYLTEGRKWTPSQIIHSTLGYITHKEADALGWTPANIGRTHQLAIPMMDAGRPRGWTFRSIQSEVKCKYINLKGNALGFLSELPSRVPDGVVIVVEGVLDAIRGNAIRTARHQENDISPFVATCGGSGLTADEIKTAKQRGVDTFILAFDNDQAGRNYTRKAAELIWKAGLTALCFSYPEGSKDLDEAISNGLDISTITAYSQPYALIIAQEIHGKVLASYSAPMLIQGARDLKDLLTRCDDIGRMSVGTLMRNASEKDNELLVQLRNMMDEQFRMDALRKSRASIYKDVAKFITEGKEGRAQRLLHQLNFDDVRDIFSPQSTAIFEEQYPDKGNIATLFDFSSQSDKANFTLPRGAVTTIGARSGHGKTAIMISLACYILKAGGKVVYCTSECNVREMNGRFISIWRALFNVDKDQARRDIDSHLGKTLWIYRERDVERICTISRLQKPDVCFIDYMQLLRIKGYFATKKDRMEACCNAMEEAVTQMETAFVLGAQLNRADCTDPISMDTNSIADAIDIEQFSNQIYLLWNSKMRPQIFGKDAEKKINSIKEQLPNFPLRVADNEKRPQTEMLYLKCVKARSSMMSAGFTAYANISRAGAVSPQKITSTKFI